MQHLGIVQFNLDIHVTNLYIKKSFRVVTKISSCRPGKCNKQAGNQTARDFFSVLFFFYFPIKVAGENPRPPALNDNPVFGIMSDFFTPIIVKYMKKDLDITKPYYSEHILPGTRPFVIQRFHCTARYSSHAIHQFCHCWK